MKNTIFLFALLLSAHFAQGQDRGLYWKYKDYDGAISVTVPQWVVHLGSWFLDEKADRKMLRKVHKARVLVFEHGSPITDRDWRKFNRKARHRHLEELLTVREGKTRVKVLGKERRNALRKVVVIADDPEDGFALVSLRGKLRWEDINRILEQYDKEDEGKKPVLPGVIKVPVSKV